MNDDDQPDPRSMTPAARARYWAELRALGPEGRVRRALELSEQLRQRELGEIRNEHPDWPDLEVSKERVRRVFPEAAYLMDLHLDDSR